MPGVLDELLEVIPADCAGRVRAGLRAALDARGVELDAVLVDLLIYELDELVSAQLDEILHAPGFQRLEAAWRGLAFAVERIRFEENIRVEFLSCTKQELAHDFADCSELPQSGLYRLVYATAFGTFGGDPYGLLCADFEFGPGAEDLELLRRCAAVAAVAHAPFVANACADLLGLDSFVELPRMHDLDAIFAGPRYRPWQSFRETEDARYVGLCLPRFLLRTPYCLETDPSRPLRYRERVSAADEHHLWGHASFAFAARAADSFARYRWCVHIAGSRTGGAIEGLVRHEFPTLRGLVARCPVECLLTGRLEHELSHQGLIGLVYDRASGAAMFHSAASVQRAGAFVGPEDAKEAAAGHRLGTQLPYVFLVSRLAHYLKKVQREHIGQWDTRDVLRRELELWLRQYVSDVDDPHWETRASRPFRRASLRIETIEGQTGWYRCHLQLQPHLTHNSATFTLSLVGRLDRAAGANA